QGRRHGPRDQGSREGPGHPVPGERRKPLAPRRRALFHELVEQQGSAAHRRRAASRGAGRQGVGARDDPDGVSRRRAGNARGRGEGGLMHVLRAKTVAESHAETTRMARRLFVSPPAQRMVLPILAFSLMESFLLEYPSLDGGRTLLGAIAIALPAYIAGIATVPVPERLGGRMYFRRPCLLVSAGPIMSGAVG